MARQFGLIALLLLLTSCEDETQEWRNRDLARMTRQQFDADSYQCDHDNQETPVYVRSAYGAVVPLGGVDHRMAARCMAAHGWYRVR
jgi:hypothetical protein